MPYGGGPVQRDMGASLGASEVMKMTTIIKSLEELISEGIITLGRGKIISKKDIATTPGTYPIYSSAQMNEGKFGEYGLYMFDEEMITWSIDGGGRFFYRKKHRFSVTNVGGTLRINDTSILDYRYLYYQLCQLHARINFDWVLKAHPSVIRRLYTEIKIPSLSEQKRIVAILDKADVIKKESNKSQDLHKSLVLSLFRNMFGDPLLNPMGWEKVAISELIEKMHQGINTAADKVIYANSGIPIIQSKHIENGKILLESTRFLGPSDAEKYREKYTVLQNDILFSNIGTIGKTAIADNQNFMFAWNVFLFRLRIERISTIFFKVLLDYLVTAEYFERFMTGGTVKFVNKKTIAKTEIPLPPLDLQLEFVSLVNHLTHIFDSIDYGVEQKIELASSSIQSLIA